MNNLALAALGLCLLAVPSHAQDLPIVDLSAGYSPLYIVKGYTVWMNGANGSAAFNANNWFSVVGDLGGYVGHIPQTFSGETYMAGPRFSYRRRANFAPFAQALFGWSHFDASPGGITGNQNEFTFALGGGADLISPSGRFGLRPQLQYVGIHSAGSITPAIRLSVGVVYRIGAH